MNKRKRQSKRAKPTRRMLTDKERQAAASEHWDLSHGMPDILSHKTNQPTPQHNNGANKLPIPFMCWKRKQGSGSWKKEAHVKIN